MSERFQMSSPVKGPSYRGLFILASAAIATAVMLLPIDLLSRTVLLVWSLMVIHMLISIKKMLLSDNQGMVPVRSSGGTRTKDQFYASGKGNNGL